MYITGHTDRSNSQFVIVRATKPTKGATKQTQTAFANNAYSTIQAPSYSESKRPAGDIHPQYDQRRIISARKPTSSDQPLDHFHQRQNRHQVVLTAPSSTNQTMALYNFDDPTAKFYSKKAQPQRPASSKLPIARQTTARTINKSQKKAQQVISEFELKAKFAQRQLNAYHDSKAHFHKSPSKDADRAFSQMQIVSNSENYPPVSTATAMIMRSQFAQNIGAQYSPPHRSSYATEVDLSEGGALGTAAFRQQSMNGAQKDLECDRYACPSHCPAVNPSSAPGSHNRHIPRSHCPTCPNQGAHVRRCSPVHCAATAQTECTTRVAPSQAPPVAAAARIIQHQNQRQSCPDLRDEQTKPLRGNSPDLIHYQATPERFVSLKTFYQSSSPEKPQPQQPQSQQQQQLDQNNYVCGVCEIVENQTSSEKQFCQQNEQNSRHTDLQRRFLTQQMQSRTPQKWVVIRKQETTRSKSAQRKQRQMYSECEMDMGPGAYTEGKKFGDQAVTYSIIGGRKPQQLSENPGPGFYQPINSQTKPTSVECLIRRKPVSPITPTGPEFYEEHRNFGNKLPDFKMGTRREQSREKSVGPGEYEPQIGEGLTKPSVRQVKIRPQGSPDRYVEPGLGPGQYYQAKQFGHESEAHEFGKRYEKVLQDAGPGPGFYSPEKGDNITKSKSQSTQFENRTGRVDKVVDPTNGPGTFEPHIKFGQKLNQMTIGTKTLSKSPQSNVGPGFYSPERGDSVTRYQSRAADFNKIQGRPQQVADPTNGPGTYALQHDFGSESKPMTIGVRRDQGVEKTLGPGEYELEKGVKMTKPSQRATAFENQTGREVREGSPTLGPGYYDRNAEFGHDLQQMTIGRKYQSKSGEHSPGPGYYSPEKGDKQTKFSASAVDFQKMQRRKEHIPDSHCGPGTYEHKINFGDKAMTIGVKREEKSSEKNPGPGYYSPEKGDRQTKYNTSTVEFGKIQGRGVQEADHTGGPGTYALQHDFGSESKPMTIGVRREQGVEKTLGPGEYELEKGVKMTKPSQRATAFENQTGREVREGSPTLGPGTYEHYVEFGYDLKQMSIGRKPDVKYPEQKPGPGYYQIEQADNITKAKTQGVDFTHTKGRAEQSADNDIGPGSYEYPVTDMNQMTIGERRDLKKPDLVPAPGEYNTDRAISLTKPTSASTNFVICPGRLDQPQNPTLGPGTYLSQNQFGSNSKGVTIGEKREGRAPDEIPGPGYYSHEKGDKQTRYNASAAEFSKIQGRAVAEPNRTGGPGEYDLQYDFGSDSKPMTIGERRGQKIEPTLGPGQYELEKGDQITKPSQRATAFENQTGRQVRDSTTDIGPGTYEHNTEFGYDLKQMTIGRKPDVKYSDQNPGPGYYGTEQADKVTKAKGMEVDFGHQTGRPNETKDGSIGPGTYDFQYYFGSDSKKMTIGEKREGRAPDEIPGPGYYSHEKGDKQTRYNASAAEFGKIQGRAVAEPNRTGGPGEYDLQYDFGSDSKPMTFGERRGQKIESTIGPGEYELEQGVKMTKPSQRVTAFENQTGREILQASPALGPGTYEHNTEFGHDLKQMTIGRKPDVKSPESNPGPGYYGTEQADKVTKAKGLEVDFSHKTGRPNETKDGTIGPGTYDLQYDFGSDSKKMTIGEKREGRAPEEIPGPGVYEVEKGTGLIKPSSHSYNFAMSPGRIDQQSEPIPGPGSYIHQCDFTQNTQGLTIGVKREQRSPEKNPGPGSYSHEKADHLVKPKGINTDFQHISSRIQQKSEPNHGPGYYDLQYDFGSDSKNMTIGEKREGRAPDQIPGPGGYEIEKGTELIKPNTFKASFAQSTGRIVQQFYPLPGPGSYIPNQSFISQKMTIGEKREGRVPDQNPGPGSYSYEKADPLVKPRGVETDFQHQSSRLQQKTDDNHGPGSYDLQQDFGADSKKMTIGEKREGRAADQIPGPGVYNPDLASMITRPTPKTANFSNSQGRIDQVPEPYPGPGSYIPLVNLSQSSQGVTIGVHRYQTSPDKNPGPGSYAYERADPLVKPSQFSTDFQSKSMRPLSNQSSNGGPGSYDQSNSFVDELGHMTIGERRETNVRETIGPARYDPQEQLIKPSSPTTNFVKQSGRKDDPTSQPLVGPGSYTSQGDLSSDSKQMTIGVKRDPLSPDQYPGPGQYSPEKADHLVKATSPEHDFMNQAARITETSSSPIKQYQRKSPQKKSQAASEHYYNLFSGIETTISRSRADLQGSKQLEQHQPMIMSNTSISHQPRALPVIEEKPEVPSPTKSSSDAGLSSQRALVSSQTRSSTMRQMQGSVSDQRLHANLIQSYYEKHYTQHQTHHQQQQPEQMTSNPIYEAKLGAISSQTTFKQLAGSSQQKPAGMQSEAFLAAKQRQRKDKL